MSLQNRDEYSIEEHKAAFDIPPWKRYVLTVTEAASFYHIGETKLRELVMDNPNEEFAILNGNRVLIKRIKFEDFLDGLTSI